MALLMSTHLVIHPQFLIFQVKNLNGNSCRDSYRNAIISVNVENWNLEFLYIILLPYFVLKYSEMIWIKFTSGKNVTTIVLSQKYIFLHFRFIIILYFLYCLHINIQLHNMTVC